MQTLKFVIKSGLALLVLVIVPQGFAQAVPANGSDPAPAVVIYRSNDALGGQVSIKRNGKLHATLEKGEFTRLPVCKDDISFEVAEATGSAPGSTKYVHTSPQFDVGRQVLHLVVGEDGVSRIATQNLADVDFRALRQHTRIASRVVNQCPTQLAVEVATHAEMPSVSEVRKLELASDMLFPFASFDLDPVKAGVLIRERLSQILLAGDVQKIASVQVIGHSDPVGQPHRKQLVSLNRAKKVAAYVQSQLGLATDRMHVEARSDAQLLVTNCPARPVSVRNTCNGPNRRVEVLISVQH